MAAKSLPVPVEYLLHRKARCCKQVHPEENSPESVLLAHMVGAGAETLLAAKGDKVCIQQVAEKFPAGRRLVCIESEYLCDLVAGLACRHRACDTCYACRIAGYEMRIGGKDCKAVTRCDKGVFTENHVTVTITVRCRGKIQPLVTLRPGNKFGCIDEVRIRMPPAKVLERLTIHDGPGGRAQYLLENTFRVRACDRMHRIECHGEARFGDEGTNGIEIEN